MTSGYDVEPEDDDGDYEDWDYIYDDDRMCSFPCAECGEEDYPDEVDEESEA